MLGLEIVAGLWLTGVIFWTNYCWTSDPKFKVFDWFGLFLVNLIMSPKFFLQVMIITIMAVIFLVRLALGFEG